MVVTCRCGHWYNTKIPCPKCNTKANSIYSQKEYISRLNEKDKLFEEVKLFKYLTEEYPYKELKELFKKVWNEFIQAQIRVAGFELAYKADKKVFEGLEK